MSVIKGKTTTLDKPVRCLHIRLPGLYAYIYRVQILGPFHFLSISTEIIKKIQEKIYTFRKNALTFLSGRVMCPDSESIRLESETFDSEHLDDKIP